MYLVVSNSLHSKMFVAFLAEVEMEAILLQFSNDKESGDDYVAEGNPGR